MSFNAEGFVDAPMAARTKEIPVPALAGWFSGEDPVWVVRGLEGGELFKAMEAKQRAGSIDAIVKAVAQSGDQAEAVRRALGLTNDVPAEMAKRLEMLVAGTVRPAIDKRVAVKLAKAFPIEFLQITGDIITLTGQGHDLVKPEAASPPTMA